MSSVSAVNTLLSGTATTTPSINISSILASVAGATTPGIDVTAAVAAGIYADRAPERLWQADQVTLTSQTTALTTIQTATTALNADMSSLSSLAGPLAARTVTSSNSNDVTATAATGTVAGVHTVVVNSLATTGSWYSDLAANPTATLPASSFTLTTTAGPSLTVSTGTGATGDNLADLATAINGDKALGVTATVVSDATGSRLAIISSAPGSANDFSITSTNYTGTSWTSPDIPPGSTLGANSVTLSSGTGASLATLTVPTTTGETYAQLATAINTAVTAFNSTATTAVPPTPTLNVTATAGSDANGTSIKIASSDGTTPFTVNEPAFGFTQSYPGANASLTVDGVPISSASNTVTGAIPGVTLTLLGASYGSPASLTVASDATQVSTAINQFVTDYNTALGLVNTQFSITNGAQGVLGSDPTMRALQGALQGVLNYVNTPATGTTTVSTLSDLGISAGTDGSLSVNSATLNAALINNPLDVQNFFEGASLSNGFANATTNALASFTSPANGAFTVDLSSISASSTAITSEISNYETNYIAYQQTSLTAMYSAAEIALQQLPQQMAQLNAELGLTPTNSNGG